VLLPREPEEHSMPSSIQRTLTPTSDDR